MARIAVAALAALILAGFAQGLNPWLEMVSAFRPHLGVLALVLCLILLRHRWRLAAVSGAMAALALAALGPVWDDDKIAAEGVQVRILAANVYFQNDALDELAEALIAADADVLITVETPLALRDRLIEAYPNVVQRERFDRPIRAAIWSRLPLTAVEVNINDNRAPVSASAVVEVAEDAALGLIGVHFARVNEGAGAAQVEGLARMTRDLDVPFAIAGDFNAVPWQRLMAMVQAATGARIAGGYRVTWRGRYPGGWPEPWGHPIDHVMTGPEVGLSDLQTVNLPGSDHEGLLFTLTVPHTSQNQTPLFGAADAS